MLANSFVHNYSPCKMLIWVCLCNLGTPILLRERRTTPYTNLLWPQIIWTSSRCLIYAALVLRASLKGKPLKKSAQTWVLSSISRGKKKNRSAVRTAGLTSFISLILTYCLTWLKTVTCIFLCTTTKQAKLVLFSSI